MRVFMREVVDLDKPLNMKKLNWKEKIRVSIAMEIRGTKLYQYADKKAKDKEAAYQVFVEDSLKNALLAQIYHGFTLEGREVKEVFLEVKREYESALARVLRHKEFSVYLIQRVPENQDIRVAYPDMPILLKCKRQILEEVTK